MSLFNSLKFSLQYGWNGFKMKIAQHFDIHHHVLPFSVGRTFNLAVFTRPNLPFVVGPVQSSLPYFGDSMQDHKEIITLMSKYVRVLSKTVLTITKPLTNILSVATLKRANAIIAIDGHTKRILLDLGIEDSKVIIIPPGINVDKYARRSAKRNDRNTFSLLSVGALIERKGYDCLIKAFARVYQQHKNVRLNILGDGPKKDELTKLCKELNIVEAVTFHGLVDHAQVPSFYAEVDAFVSATRYESFGQMYLEAMASSLPIITTKNLGALTISERHPTITLVNMDDPVELADAINDLVVDRQKTAQLGMDAYNAVQHFDWDKSIIPKYIKLYQKLLR